MNLCEITLLFDRGYLIIYTTSTTIFLQLQAMLHLDCGRGSVGIISWIEVIGKLVQMLTKL